MKRFFGILGLSALVLSAAEAPMPPVAKQVPHTQVWHGKTFVDPYFWLREKQNPDVAAYLKAENAYTEARTQSLKPFQDALYKELLGRIKQTDLSVPTFDNGFFHYSRTVEGQQYPLFCRRNGSMEAPEEVYLDQNELAKGKAVLGLGDRAISDDNARLAYTTDETGFRQYTLHVKDLVTGHLLPDTAERVTSVEWAADGKTLSERELPSPPVFDGMAAARGRLYLATRSGQVICLAPER